MADEDENGADDLEGILGGWITDNASGSTTLVLAEPIGTEESPVTELEVRRPKAKQVRRYDAKKPEMDQLLSIAEDLTGLSRNQVDALGAADAMRLVALIGRDFAAGLGGISGGS